MPKRSSLIFKTDKIQVSYVYQNHLDLILGLIRDYIETNKNYKFSFVSGKNVITDIEKAESFIWNKRPVRHYYFIEDKNETEQMRISINDGVVFYIKNGSYQLFGLYNLMIDELTLAQTPMTILLLRKYWLFNVSASLVIIPSITLLLLHQAVWILLSIPIAGFLIWGIWALYYDSLPVGASTSFVLSTKIKYGEYNAKTHYPVQAALTSAKTMISIFASLATIASFALYLLTK